VFVVPIDYDWLDVVKRQLSLYQLDRARLVGPVLLLSCFTVRSALSLFLFQSFDHFLSSTMHRPWSSIVDRHPSQLEIIVTLFEINAPDCNWLTLNKLVASSAMTHRVYLTAPNIEFN
jgi:hypothetical protein